MNWVVLQQHIPEKLQVLRKPQRRKKKKKLPYEIRKKESLSFNVLRFFFIYGCFMPPQTRKILGSQVKPSLKLTVFRGPVIKEQFKQRRTSKNFVIFQYKTKSSFLFPPFFSVSQKFTYHCMIFTSIVKLERHRWFSPRHLTPNSYGTRYTV